MRELVYYVAVSLDGKIAAPDHTFADFIFDGDHMELIVRDYADTLPGPALEALDVTPPSTRFDTVLMGWNTYRVGGLDSPYPHLRQYVFTRTRTVEQAPAGVTFTAHDPVTLVRRLKENDGAGIWLCGGGQLASALVGQIDRLIVKVNPVLFGSGIPLFADDGYQARAFNLVASTPCRSGVIVNEYVRALPPVR